MRVMGFPGLYVQGRGVISQLGEWVSRFGIRPFVVSDSRVWSLYREKITTSLPTHTYSEFGGELCPEEIEVQRTRSLEAKCDVVIGLGGGKVQDTAKAVKLHTHVPVVIVPTVASNDAATSRLIITYTKEGEFLGPLFLPTNPDAVIVDTEVIRKAPIRFLKAGVADALATYYEAEECKKSGALNFFGGRPTTTALQIARLCREVVFSAADKAIDSIQRGQDCEEIEQLIEAVVLLSGLGFEGCGVAAAHAVSQGFTLIPQLRGNLHGEEVAVGLIVQLLLEQRGKDELQEIVTFYKKLGLPLSVKDLGLHNPTEEQLNLIASFACRKNSRLYNMSFPISAQDVVKALKVGMKLSS